ncbi:MAG: hypothetical protein AB8G16_03620 [Gammaproteobacteria bacterium]
MTGLRAFTACTLLAFGCFAHAQAGDIETWQKTANTHPAGTVYVDGQATLARYPMSALDAANGGGLASVSTQDPRARMEWALSVVELGMSEFEMTKLSGMPAAVGTAETYSGEVSFAASFSGRTGSAREMLSVFFAPPAAFDALGGMDMLANNRPSAGVNYAAAASNAVSSKPRSKPVARPKPKRKPKTASTAKPKPKSTSSTAGNGGMSSGAASLLAGVRGDLDKMAAESAKTRAAQKAKADAEKAAAMKAKRLRLYALSGARKGHYPAPSADEEFRVWPEQGPWRIQVLSDNASPRIATRNYSPETSTPAAALRAFARETGLAIKGKPTFEPLGAYKSLDGRDVQILLTQTKLHGKTGIAFVFYARAANNPNATLRVMEMPATLYQDWGGVAAMLTMRGVIPDNNVFPSKERRRIAHSPLKEKTALYEAVLDKLYMENVLALMVTMAQTTAMMTELNYDLLFGNDLTPGPWAY